MYRIIMNLDLMPLPDQTSRMLSSLLNPVTPFLRTPALCPPLPSLPCPPPLSVSPPPSIHLLCARLMRRQWWEPGPMRPYVTAPPSPEKAMLRTCKQYTWGTCWVH